MFKIKIKIISRLQKVWLNQDLPSLGMLHMSYKTSSDQNKWHENLIN